MKVLELFCGTKSISAAFKAAGHETFTVDWEKSFNPDLQIDIGELTAKQIIKLCGGKPDVIWASPDCTSYSIAAISTHRTREKNGNLAPKSDYAKKCDAVNKRVLDLIAELKPKYYFIENPRGAMRKMDFMKGLYRYTLTYCQYGDKRMKPTDIWTNHPDPKFKPMCKNGDSCHEPAPRGSQTGTQGLKNSKERARIPEELCKHIVRICEGENGGDTWHERIKAMPIDEMASFLTYLNSRGVIATADRYICNKCKAEHGGHCSIGDDDKCLYDMGDKETFKLWLESDGYKYGTQ